MEVFTSKELCPLYRLLRILFCLIDNRVYTQQYARRAEVGYETFYENKFVQLKDLLDFDSQATKEEFGTKDKLNSQGMAQGKSQKDCTPRPFTKWLLGRKKLTRHNRLFRWRQRPRLIGLLLLHLNWVDQ